MDKRINDLYADEIAVDAGFQKLTPEAFVPAPETVLVRKHDRVKQVGKVVLPEVAQKESTTGTVVAVSADEAFLEAGDVVLMDTTAAENPAARPFASDKNLIVLHCYRGRESDILGKFKT